MNDRMEPLYQSAIAEAEHRIQEPTPKLADFIDFGLEEVGTAFLLATLEERAKVNVTDFENLTEYECFVNRLRVQDYVENAGDVQAVAEAYDCATALNEKLTTFAPKERFRYIITSGKGCVLRFHMVRPGERWREGDAPENSVAVLTLESADFAGSTPELVTIDQFRDLPEALLAKGTP